MKKDCLNCNMKSDCKEYAYATLTHSEYVENLKRIKERYLEALEDKYEELELADEEEALEIESEIEVLEDIVEDCAYHIQHGPSASFCSNELAF